MNHLSLLLLQYPYYKIIKIKILLNQQQYDLIEYINININKTMIFSKIKKLNYFY